MRMKYFAPVTLCLFLSACGGDGDGGDGGVSGIGGPCEGAGDCGSGLSCLNDPRFPGGYCTALCPEGTCPADGLCEPAIAPALCLARCAAPDDCRDEYQCWRGACRARCDADADCEGGRCEAGQCVEAGCEADGGCIAPDASTGGALGEACASDGECESGVCLPAALGGVCTIPCADARACIDAIGDAGCTAVPHDADGDGAAEAVRAICAPLPADARSMGSACTADAECAGRLCQEGQCTEVCDDDGDCLRGQICTDLTRAGVAGATYRGCGYRERAGAVQVVEVDLGEVSVTAGGGTQLELALPPDAVSLTLQARRVSGDPLPLVFVEVTDPTNATIFDLDRVVELEDTPERWLPFDTGESIAMVVPNTTPDRLALVAGRYRWSVAAAPRTSGDGGRATMQLSAIVERAAGAVVSSGTLDLNVFLVGVDVSAASAPGNARLQAALARFDAVLRAEANVALGAVAYYDVSGADETRYRIIDSTAGEDSELAGLFRLSAPFTGRRLNIFLVESIEEGGGGFQALGIAGGIPGAVGLHGTQHSGVVAAYEVGGSDVIGHVLAHETGHYLGLFHTTEQARPCGPGETPSAGCAPFGGGDTLADTAHGDTTNLMHWRIVDDGANDRLSGGQAFVLRLNPLVAP